MRVPPPLEPLVDTGVIDEVLRPLMSGKEAQVYLVRAGEELRIAKVYKEAQHRSFKHRADYTEGRRVRNSRQQRAMTKRSRFGREQVEDAWRSAEVDAIFKLAAAGVRVPKPFDFVEGVLVMELISDEKGEPAPRLVDVQLNRAESEALFELLVREVVKMLCAGVVHGDLSDFNVLIGAEGPVIIDFPQVVDPAFNRNARKLLLRDVRNLAQFLGRRAPQVRNLRYGPEMWDLYEKGALQPDTALTGRYSPKRERVDTMSLLEELADLERESLRRREALGLGPPRPARRPVEVGDTPKPVDAKSSGGGKRGGGGGGGGGGSQGGGSQGGGGQGDGGQGGASKKRRRRRRRSGGGEGASQQGGQGQPTRSRDDGGRNRPSDGPIVTTRGARPPQSGGGAAAAPADDAPKKRRRRRRRRRSGGGDAGNSGGGGSDDG